MAKGKKSVFFCQNCGYESAKWSGQCPACKEWNTFVEEPMEGNKTVSYMAKGKKSVFFCQNCGYESAKWSGQCPACKEWNTFVEEPMEGNKTVSTVRAAKSAKIVTLRDVSVEKEDRIHTDIHELDRVLGGGIVPGSLILVGGDPGIGKSIVTLRDVSVEKEDRIHTDIHELDRVLGGGIVPGSLILVGGDPGIGKSTLLLQVCRNLSGQKRSVLYISGEESLRQIKLRADRIGEFSETLSLLCETNLDTIRSVIESNRPQIVVIDSIQTMYNEEVGSAPGSVSQVRESTNVLMQLAKGLGIVIFIVGHVTKEGTVAGPRVLEHMVDTVLYFEGDRHASYRILRGVKNRFGSTNEIGVFEMQQTGLVEVANPSEFMLNGKPENASGSVVACSLEGTRPITNEIGVFEMQQTGLVEVANPSEFMLNGKPENASGSVVACSLEGTRPILIEIQALVSRSGFGMPRRTAAGTDYNRVNLLMAVLEKRLGMGLADYDAYVNIAGGIKMTEPAIDLGIVLALVSSYRNRVISDETIVFGEVGLSGEVRAVSMPEQRVNEAKKLGFTRCIMPAVSLKTVQSIKGIEIIGVKTINEAVQYI